MELHGKGDLIDLTEARWLLDLMARDGDPYAQTDLALAHIKGQDGRVNLAEARRLLTLAAEAGHANAQFNLALMCSWQAKEGEPVDLAEARRLLTLAADQGHDGAQFNLALMYSWYAEEEGGAVDFVAALVLWWLALVYSSNPPF